jgi:homoprotocatechuate degradation regulator HpaR
VTETARKSLELRLRDFRHSLPMELLKAREAAMARFGPVLGVWGLTEKHWRFIRALSEYQPLDASELATRSFLLAPSLTRILKNLEKQGLITRSADSSDQRRQVVSLSSKGRKRFDQAAPESEALYAEIEAEFGVDRLELLYELLSEFYTTIDRAKE